MLSSRCIAAPAARPLARLSHCIELEVAAAPLPVPGERGETHVLDLSAVDVELGLCKALSRVDALRNRDWSQRIRARPLTFRERESEGDRKVASALAQAREVTQRRAIIGRELTFSPPGLDWLPP